MRQVSDPINDNILQIVAGIAARERSQIDAIRMQVRTNGSVWAAAEIFKLRLQLAQARGRSSHDR